MDRMEESTLANPADLRGISDDEVAVATAMVSGSCLPFALFVYIVSCAYPPPHHTLPHTPFRTAGPRSKANRLCQPQPPEEQAKQCFRRLQPPHRGPGQLLQEAAVRSPSSAALASLLYPPLCRDHRQSSCLYHVRGTRRHVFAAGFRLKAGLYEIAWPGPRAAARTPLCSLGILKATSAAGRLWDWDRGRGRVWGV